MTKILLSLLFAAGCLLTCACGSSSGPDVGSCALENASAFVQPDGSLLLTGTESLLLGNGTCTFPSICVADDASLRVRGSTSIHLTGENTTVIAAGGIGSEGTDAVTINLQADGAAELYLLFENQVAPVTLMLEAPQATATIAITGQAGLTVDGTGAENITYNAGWGDTHNFPACK